MKKTILIALPVLFFAFSACKKDRTCECTSTSTSSYTDKSGNTSSSTGAPSTTKTDYKKVKKSSLDFSCGNSKYVSTGNNADGSSSTYVTENKCSIK